MKAQIIQLEAHDDVASTRDKMNWDKTGRIILVWPDSARMLRRRLDLTILQRHSISLGAQMAIVAKDSELREHARRLGIPVFKTLLQAQQQHWRSPRRSRSIARLRSYVHGRSPSSSRPDMLALRALAHPATPGWLTHPIFRVSVFALSLLAILALAAVLLPHATIALSPQVSQQTIILPVSANPALTVLNLAGELPARLTTITIEGRSSITPTGTVLVPQASAIGGVEFTNLTEQEINVPANTIVSTLAPAIRFRTTTDSKVPAGAGNKKIIPVQAIAPGAAGNLPAHSIQSVESSLGLSLSVTNLTPTRGGLDHAATGPTEQDRTRLYNQLFATLQESASQELSNHLAINLETGNFPLTPTVQFSKVLEQIYEPAGALPADRLDLTLRLEFEVQYVSGDDLRNLVIPVLEANLPEGFSALPGSITIQPITPPEITALPGPKTTVSWQIRASQQIVAEIPTKQAAEQVRGVPLPQAGAHLQNILRLDAPPKIQVWPAWWPYLPFLPFRIEIQLPPGQGAPWQD